MWHNDVAHHDHARQRHLDECVKLVGAIPLGERAAPVRAGRFGRCRGVGGADVARG